MRTCRHCGYDLRGLPENVCPECGKTFDPNALCARRYPGAGVVGSIVAVMSAMIVVARSVSLTFEAVAHQSAAHTCCTHCGFDFGESLVCSGMVGIIIASLGWRLTAWSGLSTMVARCATITAMAGWVACGFLSP